MTNYFQGTWTPWDGLFTILDNLAIKYVVRSEIFLQQPRRPLVTNGGHRRPLIGIDRYHILQWLGGHWSPLVPFGTNGHQSWSPMGEVRTHVWSVAKSAEVLQMQNFNCILKMRCMFFLQIYAVVSMFFVVLSIAIFCLETYYWFRIPIPGAQPQNASDSFSAYYAANGAYCFRKDLKTSYLFADTEPHPAMVYMDYVCAAYFTIEFIFRFSFSPSKLGFMKAALNVIDLLCLIPHLIAIILITVDPYGASKDTSSLFKSMLALRTVRILRIFKLMKHYSAFKILVYTIKVSAKELLLLVVFLFTGVLIFASVIFYAENETFNSIPVGFWWALVTMTTVGYGDVVPKTEAGYVIGCVCVLCGVLTVAFTVPIVVNNFTLYYSHAQSRIKLPVHKRKELKRKIFLKNQKSLEFLQKLKWKRDHKKEFTELETIQSPRAPPCGQEATAEVNTPPKTNVTTSLVSQTVATYKPNSPNRLTSNGRVSPTPIPSPDRITTVSESIDISIADSITLPGTPVDLAEHQVSDNQKTYKPEHDKTNKMIHAPSKDSDQP